MCSDYGRRFQSFCQSCRDLITTLEDCYLFVSTQQQELWQTQSWEKERRKEHEDMNTMDG